MHRREFLSTFSVLVVGGSTFLIACENESGTPNGDTPAAAPKQSGTQVVYTTNQVGDHSHTFAIEMSALATPPAAGVSGDTSSADGHMHSVTVPMADLKMAAAGQMVKVTTGSGGGHMHVLTIVKLA